MVKDALRGYVALAGGLSEITAARARAAAKALVEQGEATAGQVGALAEDLLSTSRRNRESIVLLVRHEVEQTVRRLGLASAAEVDTLTKRIRELERGVRELKTAKPAPAPPKPAAKRATQPKPAQKKSTTKATAKPKPKPAAARSPRSSSRATGSRS